MQTISFRKLISKHRFLFFVLLFSLVIKLIVYCFFQPWDESVVKEKMLVSDDKMYHDLAVTFLNTGTFRGSGDADKIGPQSMYYNTHHLDTLKPPGYSFLLAVIYFLFGVHPYVVILFQIVFSLLSIIYLYKLASRLFPEKKIAHIACLIFALEPHQLYYVYHILSDSLYVTLLLFTIFVLVKGIQDGRSFYLLFVGFLGGVLTMIRPIAEFLPILFLFLIFVGGFNSWKWKIKSAVLYSVIYCLSIFPWMWRNHHYYDHYILVTGGQYTLLMYDAVYTEVAKTGLADTVVMAKFHEEAVRRGYNNSDNPFDKSAIYEKLGIEYVKKNVVIFTEKHLEGMINMLVGIGNKNIAYYLGISENKPGMGNAYSFSSNLKKFFSPQMAGETLIGLYILLVIGICYLFSFIGLFKLLREKKYFILFILIGLIGYHCALTGVIGVNRYKLPITPFYIILASYGIYFAFRKYFEREKIR
ncbi:MAG TPA: glycosyltransferase family 39 protein [Bacteroidia bacterium]